MPVKRRGTQYAVGNERFGTGTNYTDFSTSGRMTMAGTSRVRKSIWIPADQWYGVVPSQWVNSYNANIASAGSTSVVLPMAMAFGDSGSNPSVPVITASAACGDSARMATVRLAPADADTTGSVAVSVYYTTRLDMDETGCAQVWRLHGQYIGSAGSAEVGNSTCTLTGGSMVGQGLGVVEVLSLGNLPSFNRASSPMVFLQLAIEGESTCSYMNDSGSAEEAVFGVELVYTACALGAASPE